MPDKERFLELIDKYTLGNISPEEHSELFSFLLSEKYNETLSGHVSQQLSNEEVPGADLAPHRAQEIMHRVLSSEKQTHRMLPAASSHKAITGWAVAASILVCIAVASWLWLSPHRQKNNAPAVLAALPEKQYQKTNTANHPLAFRMEDQTIITLQPGASISYPAHFQPAKREVYLTGEAFFDVSRNPQRPFYVYYKNLVTHVLGTSFNVRINEQKKQMEVDVRTGRVEVYEKTTDTIKNDGARTGNGVILTPNQKVIYTFENRRFESSIVDIPLPILHGAGSDPAAIAAQNYVYDGAPLSGILRSLQKTYGIDIVVENDNINNCLFTGDISNQNLYEKLDILCQSLNDSYEIKGTRIVIRGKGCN
ncbi:MAG TPA: FecR family protein [Chitinophagaceae bacterium]